MHKLHKEGVQPQRILRTVNAGRAKKRVDPVSQSAVYRFLAGESYTGVADETRGRPSGVGSKQMAVYDTVRKRLIKDSKNEFQVTWEDIATEGQKELRKRKLLKRKHKGLSAETLRKRCRAELGIGSRPAPRHVTRTAGDEKRRFRQAKAWSLRSSTFWQREIHAYIDNSKFIMARTADQRRRMRQAKVTHHLRKASERTDPMFIVPKRGHCLPGIPSVEITAAVAKDRIIMWRVAGPWNGKEAAAMYKDLRVALARTWGVRGRYRIVEDGDPKGYQSNKGKEAKKAYHMESWRLPPRSPEWMPLDYALWSEIERRMLDAKIVGVETKRQYLARLRRTALGLPKSYIKKVLAQMKPRIQATVQMKGRHISMD